MQNLKKSLKQSWNLCKWIESCLLSDVLSYFASMKHQYIDISSPEPRYSPSKGPASEPLYAVSSKICTETGPHGWSV